MAAVVLALHVSFNKIIMKLGHWSCWRCDCPWRWLCWLFMSPFNSKDCHLRGQVKYCVGLISWSKTYWWNIKTLTHRCSRLWWVKRLHLRRGHMTAAPGVRGLEQQSLCVLSRRHVSEEGGPAKRRLMMSVSSWPATSGSMSINRLRCMCVVHATLLIYR